MRAAPGQRGLRPPHAQVEQARTPPAAFYIDPAQLHDERSSVLRRCWQYVGHRAQLPAHGDYFTTRLADEPLLLVNDGGTVRGFFNVCRHRAGPLAQGCGNLPRLICRYHGWTYDLQGQLLRAPEMDGARPFDSSAIHLQPFKVHQIGALIFAALDPLTPDFEVFHARLGAQWAPFHLERMQHALHRDYAVAANWKLYVDNYLEGYHLPLVHPGLSGEIDYRCYVTELGSRHVLQHAPVRSGTASLYHQAAGEPNASYYWLFPNVCLNFYERQLQINVVMPVDAAHTVVRFDWFTLDGWAQDAQHPHFQELLGLTEAVQAEDAAICQAVQQNLHSSAYRPGPYSSLREAGVHLFHRLMLSG
jgi:choline monooxygenase